MGEINYQGCCISCIHHDGIRCLLTRRKKSATFPACGRYLLNPDYNKEVKYDKTERVKK